VRLYIKNMRVENMILYIYLKTKIIATGH